MAAVVTVSSSCAARGVVAASRPAQAAQRTSFARGGNVVVVKGLGCGTSGLTMRRRRGSAGCAALNRSEGVAAAMKGGDDSNVDGESMTASAAAAAAAGLEEEDETTMMAHHGEAEKPFDLTLASTALMATFAFAFFAEPSCAADLAQQMGGGGDIDGANVAGAHELWSVAGGEVSFWANMVKYARFSISIMVGFAFMFGRPVVNLLKKPQTAVLVIGGGYGGYKFFRFTIETMLGLSDPDTLNYEMHY